MIWLSFIFFEIGRNYFLIEGLEVRPHYGYSAMIRFAFGAIFLFVRHPEFDPLGDVTTIFPAVTYACFQWSSFYLLFDPLLNILRGKKFNYQGKNSGTLDRRPQAKYYLLKIASAVVLILSLIVML